MDQNDSLKNENDDHHRYHDCQDNYIRPSSSSSTRAPSWSLGFGANLRAASKDSDSDGDHGSREQLDDQSINGSLCCCCSRSMLESQNGPVASNHRCRCHCRNRRTKTNSNDDQQHIPTCPEIRIEIPVVYLARKDPSSSSSGSFHVYQVNLKTSTQAEWSVYRRYSQFFALHQQLKANEPAIGKFSFPPKRRLNSKASTIVQERRRKLEEYMGNLSEFIVKCPLESVDSSSYETLTNLAKNGPLKPARRSIRSGVSSLYEVDGVVDGSLTDSARSEHTITDEDTKSADTNNIESTVDADNHEVDGQVEEETRSGRQSGIVVIEETGHLETPTAERDIFRQTNKKRAKSIRYLFYDFISPDGTNEAEFELDHLGV